MAIKRECDRCGKQWDVNKDRDEDFGTTGELCTLNMSIPQKPGTRYENRNTTYGETVNPKSIDWELCQDCAREIYKFAKERPASANES